MKVVVKKRARAKARARTILSQEMKLRTKTLKSQQVTPAVQRRYVHFVRELLRWWVVMCNEPAGRDDLDRAVSQYIEACWAEGGALYAARHTVAGLLWAAPFVRPYLHDSWKLLAVWEKLVPPRRAAPISTLMVCAMAGA